MSSFTHSTETVLWVQMIKIRRKHNLIYDMKELNNGKQMKDVWEFSQLKEWKRNMKAPT